MTRTLPRQKQRPVVNDYMRGAFRVAKNMR